MKVELEPYWGQESVQHCLGSRIDGEDKPHTSQKIIIQVLLPFSIEYELNKCTSYRDRQAHFLGLLD